MNEIIIVFTPEEVRLLSDFFCIDHHLDELDYTEEEQQTINNVFKKIWDKNPIKGITKN